MGSLKAWSQSPEDWKIKPYMKPRRKTIKQKLTPWIVAVVIPLAVMLVNWVVEKVCVG